VITPRRLVLSGVALLAVVVFALWTTSSGDFLYVPNEARPVAGNVEVEGDKGEDEAGGIYFIDVRVRKARRLEQLLPFMRPEGATLVPAQAVTPPGQTFAQWRVQARRPGVRSSRPLRSTFPRRRPSAAAT
jgi:hypothetical protein